MQYPCVFDRVRVSGRDGQFVIVGVDQFASLVDICPQSGSAALERGIPFDHLSVWTDPMSVDSGAATSILASMRDTLYSSSVQVAASYRSVDELKNLVQATQDRIGIAQQQIIESDRLIARVRLASSQDIAPETD